MPCCWQGGLFVLEPEALIGLIHGYSAYLYFISSKMSDIQSPAPVREQVEAGSGVNEVNIPSQQEIWYPVKAFSIDVTQFATGFVCVDEYGKLYYLCLHLKLNFQRNDNCLILQEV